MVRKVFFDENENELELFINEDGRFVITITNDNEISHVLLNKIDVIELQRELNILFYNYGI